MLLNADLGTFIIVSNLMTVKNDTYRIVVTMHKQTNFLYFCAVFSGFPAKIVSKIAYFYSFWSGMVKFSVFCVCGASGSSGFSPLCIKSVMLWLSYSAISYVGA